MNDSSPKLFQQIENDVYIIAGVKNMKAFDCFNNFVDFEIEVIIVGTYQLFLLLYYHIKFCIIK